MRGQRGGRTIGDQYQIAVNVEGAVCEVTACKI
jgi:hypothetical protein